MRKDNPGVPERRGPDQWLTWTAALATAVNGGVFFDFSFVVMPGLRELPSAQGIAAMQALDRTAVTPPLMLAMYGTSALCLVLIVRAAMRWRTPPAPWLLAAAITFLFATVVITGAGNVPVSASVDALDPTDPGAATRWDELYTQWVWWNHARVLTALAAAAGFLIAATRPWRQPG
ncbi:DUF1772 domain-containing protein [Nocardia brasiliensis]|uniref:anthrone oxygenase family protein n=1 Tax=Nocardia brasiliensis TaxID=37326 RepID=UPI003D8B5A6E